MSKNPKWQDLRDGLVEHERKARLKALTDNQRVYLEALESAKAVFCVGPAGTGKTYLACGKAAEFLQAGRVERVVFSRPLLECDEEVGTLPGDLWEKVEGMMRPLLDGMEEFLGRDQMARMRNDGKLVAAPLAKLRGATLKNAFVILDEAQNATARQLRMFLTRFGKNSRMVVCGDHTQSDLPHGKANALAEALRRMERRLHRDVRVIRMGPADIVRDELVQWFDMVLSAAPGPQAPSGPDDWVKFGCPGCGRSNWAPECEDRVRCHACAAVVRPWDAADLLRPTLTSSVGPAFAGLARQPEGNRR